MKSEKYAVDRIEGELAVLISDEGSILHLPKEKYSLKVNDLLLLTFEGDKLLSLEMLEVEKERRLEKNKSRLSALFAKGRKK